MDHLIKQIDNWEISDKNKHLFGLVYEPIDEYYEGIINNLHLINQSNY